MLKVLPRERPPQWLIDYRSGDPICLRDVFSESVYYPACGLDGDVLKLCMGFSHSFIYVDNCCLYDVMTKDRILAEINSTQNFRGFRRIFQREYSESELMGDLSFEYEKLRYEDGDPKYGLQPQPFFSVLTVFEPLPEQSERIRPPQSTQIDVLERFVFLFICDDGNTAFQKYYFSHRVRPKGIAIIQPGDAFGGNWTSYGREEKVFSRAVHNNHAGVPDVIIFGGMANWGGAQYRKPVWSDYPYRNYYFRGQGKALSTWSRVRLNETDKYVPIEQRESNAWK